MDNIDAQALERIREEITRLAMVAAGPAGVSPEAQRIVEDVIVRIERLIGWIRVDQPQPAAGTPSPRPATPDPAAG